MSGQYFAETVGLILAPGVSCCALVHIAFDCRVWPANRGKMPATLECNTTYFVFFVGVAHRLRHQLSYEPVAQPSVANTQPSVQDSFRILCAAGNIWAYLCQFRLVNDLEMVLEIAPESGKTTSDSEVTTLRGLLHEMEEKGLVDTKVKEHSLDRPGATDGGQPSPAMAWRQVDKSHDHGYLPVLCPRQV